MTPAVYRNARYEQRLEVAEARILHLAVELDRVCGMIQTLAFRMTPDAQIPALSETARAFGKGH